jgi:FtsP/CotA-like multicopper oxidase with cupredoxin domain
MADCQTKNRVVRTTCGVLLSIVGLLAGMAQAAVPGITGVPGTTAGRPTKTFQLSAAEGRNSQPDGASIYVWGYGCKSQPGGYAPALTMTPSCPTMQLPGPTLIVNEGDSVTVTLTNNLPPAAGNTSILFPGFNVQVGSDGTPGLLTQEAANGQTVTYTFLATTPGTHSYYSGTQGDLQIEMGLYGAIVVLPTAVPAVCLGGSSGTPNDQAKAMRSESDFRLAKSAYDHPATCYDREYLFQFAEMDARIHKAVESIAHCTGAGCPTSVSGVETEPYHPTYFLINGRSMPDDMDPHYAVQYPNQPYNGNPHMHPGELTLLRIIGQGRWQHPFHEHGNHVRVLARDGNLLLSANDPLASATNPPRLAGPLLFTTTTTPGQTLDGIFQWTGKGLNWDVFGHGYAGDTVKCIPDANGYYTSDPGAPNYYEWCGDHKKALEKNPFGQVAGGGPMTLPEPSLFVNGFWYGGSPYLGPDASQRAVGPTPIPPSGTLANPPGTEAGFAYMWHSHNEREITTNNIFPGGMLMMMLVDSREFPIDESK